MSPLRDILLVARYELGGATRTRLFQLVVAAYLLGLGFSVWVFTEIVGRMESALAETMGVPATRTPGAMLGQLQEDGQLASVIEGVAGSEEAARALLDQPALGLWVGGAAMFLLPVVMIAATSPAVAGEVHTRSIRYLLVRTGRPAIAMGKLLGQLAVVAAAGLAGVGLAWALGMVLMVGNPPAALAWTLLVRTTLGFLYALPFAGMGMAASMSVANPHVARVLGGAFLVLSPVVAWGLELHAGTDLLGRLADLGSLAWPNALWTAYWGQPAVEVVGATFHGVVIGLVWFALGLAVFQRRNL